MLVALLDIVAASEVEKSAIAIGIVPPTDCGDA